MKILLTGASGFIGRNILEQLGQKYEFLVPSTKDFNAVDTTAVDEYFKKHNIDIVIHSAVTVDDKYEFDNLRMNLNIFRHAPEVRQIIYFGSGAEYGKNRNLHKIDEKEFGKVIPEDAYGFIKYTSRLLARQHKNIVNLIIFGLYGKHERYLQKFISNAIVKNILGLPIDIKQDAVFDYLYIDDLVKIIDFFLRHRSPHHDYNVAPTNSIKLSEIAKIINQYAVAQSSAIRIENKGLNLEYTASNERLLRVLKSFKFVSYEAGIKNLYNYYVTIKQRLDKQGIIADVYLKSAKIKKNE